MTHLSPKVSIIMPAYNAQTFIRQAIQSVRQQTFTDWELILIEDCSSDETLSIRSWRKIPESG